MNFIYEIEDQTYNLSKDKADKVVAEIVKKYNSLYDARKSQIDETNALRDEIFQRTSFTRSKDNEDYKKFNLPELYELAQSFKAHLYENVYKFV